MRAHQQHQTMVQCDYLGDDKRVLCTPLQHYTSDNTAWLSYNLTKMPFHNNQVCGLVYLHDSFYNPVPLTSVQVEARVVNFTSRVEITQEFINKERNPIECVYFFPVEEEAAVVEFTAELEGRKIRTEVREKEEARQEYNQGVQNRQTAVLLEETKPDIFEVLVGHLSPGSGCRIVITYLTEIPVEEKRTKLTIPTTVAPRYTPGIDRSTQAGKIAAIQHDFNSPVQMKFQLEVLMQTEITTIQSPSHLLTPSTRKRVMDYYQATVGLSGVTTDMDRDIIVYIESEEPNKPKVLIEKKEDGSSLAMLSFVPEFKLADHQVEAVFLVDCSGSMSGQSISLAKEALQVFLHSLPVNSFFNIIIFGSSYQVLYHESRHYDDKSLKDATESVALISANLGGTEIYQPLEMILQKPLMASHARQVFVLTDGQVSNSSACIDLVKRNNSNNRVFTLGVGSSADRHLVKGMARAGMGTSAFTTLGEPIAPKIINQLKNACQPCISDVSVKWGKNSIAEGAGEVSVEIVETKKTLFGCGKPRKENETQFLIHSQVPSRIPTIYDGSRLIAYKLLDETMDINDEITVKAKTTEGDLEAKLAICKDSFIHGDSLHQLFARKLIQEVEEKLLQEYPVEGKKLITEIGLKYKVASKYTSFVGVDEKQRNSGNFMVTRQIKNQIPQNMMPGFDFRSSSQLFGAAQAKPASFQGFGCSALAHLSSPQSISSLSVFGAAPMKSTFEGAPSSSSTNTSNGSSGGIFSSLFGSSSSGTSINSSRGSFSSFLENPGKTSLCSFGTPVDPATDSGPDPSTSKVSKLAMFQAANGSFSLNPDLASTLGISEQKIQEAAKEISSDPTFLTIWVTIVVLMFFTEKFTSQKDTWELVVKKAQKWLKNCVAAGSISALEQKARGFIVPTRKCPEGHNLSLVAQRDSSAWHCDSKQRCVGGCNTDGEHSDQTVWRCSQDWRVVSGGTCDFDLCDACVQQNV